MFHLAHVFLRGCFGAGPDLILPCPGSQPIQVGQIEWNGQVFQEESEVPRYGLGRRFGQCAKVAYLFHDCQGSTQADTLHRLISCRHLWETVDTWPQASLFLLYLKFLSSNHGNQWPEETLPECTHSNRSAELAQLGCWWPELSHQQAGSEQGKREHGCEERQRAERSVLVITWNTLCFRFLCGFCEWIFICVQTKSW